MQLFINTLFGVVCLLVIGAIYYAIMAKLGNYLNFTGRFINLYKMIKSLLVKQKK